MLEIQKENVLHGYEHRPKGRRWFWMVVMTGAAAVVVVGAVVIAGVAVPIHGLSKGYR